MLFTLPCAAICARISTMAAMIVRWVRRGLSMQTRFGRSLWRALSVDMCILIRSCGTASIFTTRGWLLMLLGIAMRAVTTSIQMLLIWWRISTGASLAPCPILVPDRAILGGGIWMSGSITLWSSDGWWSLRRTPFNLICRQFLQVCDAWLKSFDTLTFSNIWAWALVMVRVDSTIAGCTIGRTCRVAEVRVRAMAGSCWLPRCEIGRLVVLAVVHFHCKILYFFKH